MKSFCCTLFISAIICFVFSTKNMAQHLVQSFIEAGTGDSEFGYSVSGAGDVNGDGFDDVIVGADAFYKYTGRAYIYYGGSPMDNVADVTMTGVLGYYFGYSVSGAGDVNGDGFDDVIVGAPDSNKAYIYYGSGSMSNNLSAAAANVTMLGVANSNFGYSVSGAGDVNGDGYADVIVGAYTYTYYVYSNMGIAYIYYGGSSMNNSPEVAMTGEAKDNYFGYSVSGAGDVNGDGFDDVIVGAPNYNLGQGKAYIYYGSGSMSNNLSAAAANVTMLGVANSNFGYSVSGAGDVNGDGYADVIVGAPDSYYQLGLAYIYYGGLAMDNAADVTMIGELPGSPYFGRSVSGAGDVNGDGFDDVIVGAPFYTIVGSSIGNTDQGRAYIYYGGSPMDSIADVTMTGEAPFNYFGRSVSGAGDVNNDGNADVIVGAPLYNTDGYANQGSAYIYYGGSPIDNTANVTMRGEMQYYDFGISVSGAGDVNGDGYADVIVGESGYNSSTGRAYIYYGGNPMNKTLNAILKGEAKANYFGYSVSGAGDVNGDGYDDVIVGAWGYNSNQGRAYIYYGGGLPFNSTVQVTLTGEATGDHFGLSVSGAGDVNGDGRADVIVGSDNYNNNQGKAYIFYGGSPMDNTADVTMTGEATNNWFGGSVSGAGDVNGDGYADVIVGAQAYNNYQGRAYIYYGGSPMDNSADVTMTGEATKNDFGYSVSGAGDVNGDGYADVIVGADGYNSNQGRAYIYYGGSPMDNAADVIMTGAAVDYFGGSVSAAGDVNNDGYDDVIVGAFEYNSGQGRAYIYYGGIPMDNAADVTMTGETTYYEFGWTLSGAGDVNGDGYADVIVGAPFYNIKDKIQAKVYIYSDDSAPTPVELSSFSANVQNQEVVLSWTTATEVNNYGFEIQRKNNSDNLLSGNVHNDWAKVGFVAGAGNSNSPKNYSFTDQPTGGTSFSYRIKQIDNNGTFKYYDAVSVNLNAGIRAELIGNYPNPFNPTTEIKFYTPIKEDVTIKIFDILGREVTTLLNQQIGAGYHVVYWNGKDRYGQQAASGVYLYRLTAGSYNQTKKMVMMK